MSGRDIVKNSFDGGLNDLVKVGGQIVKATKWGYQYGRNRAAKRRAREVEQEYGPEVADAVELAIRNGRNPAAILQRAERTKAEQAERERLLANPPPIHGSARWANMAELAPHLKGRDGFDAPSSILLGAVDGTPPRFVHWDADGHLLTIAPTRSGKAQTVIIPNLLRYRGSCVVLDPKGELYEATSAWRAANVGPVYRWAPFEEGPSPYPRHAFNPLGEKLREPEARALAEQLFPADPRAPSFFTEDAVGFITALILFMHDKSPPERWNFDTIRRMASMPQDEFRAMVQRLAASSIPAVAEAANNVLGKGRNGLPNLRDTLHSKLSRLSSATLMENMKRADFSFAALKAQPATVYIQVPFDMMAPYAPVLRIVLKAALDAMIRNPAVPEIPVLFVLDEFLQLGAFPDFRNAIRSHAGAGVRLWFFVQDMAGLQEQYENGWKPFFNCAVRQFFGINDPYTAETVSQFLGVGTVAFRNTNAGANLSASAGQENGTSGISLSSGESIQLTARPLLTPGEVVRELSGWQDNGIRQAIIDMNGQRPFRTSLVVHGASATCRARVGSWQGNGHERGEKGT